MTSKQKTSSVWPFFREDVGTPFATCTLCSSRIKRGKDGDRKNWSSKPMWTHLRSKHQTEPFNVAKRVTTGRYNLKPSNVQKLLFLKYNLRMLNYDI